MRSGSTLVDFMFYPPPHATLANIHELMRMLQSSPASFMVGDFSNRVGPDLVLGADVVLPAGVAQPLPPMAASTAPHPAPSASIPSATAPSSTTGPPPAAPSAPASSATAAPSTGRPPAEHKPTRKAGSQGGGGSGGGGSKASMKKARKSQQGLPIHPPPASDAMRSNSMFLMSTENPVFEDPEGQPYESYHSSYDRLEASRLAGTNDGPGAAGATEEERWRRAEQLYAPSLASPLTSRDFGVPCEQVGIGVVTVGMSRGALFATAGVYTRHIYCSYDKTNGVNSNI